MLPEPHRLRQRADFAAMRREGIKAGFKWAIVFYRPNHGQVSRFAFSASRKIGGAVQRNRVRRLLREAVRQQLCQAPIGFDFLFIARRSLVFAGLAEATGVVAGAFDQAKTSASNAHRISGSGSRENS